MRGPAGVERASIGTVVLVPGGGGLVAVDDVCAAITGALNCLEVVRERCEVTARKALRARLPIVSVTSMLTADGGSLWLGGTCEPLSGLKGDKEREKANLCFFRSRGILVD